MSTTPYFEGTVCTIPQSRYVLPSSGERIIYGYKRQDPHTRLFEDRIVLLGIQVDDASADDVMVQLLVLESQDPDSLITIYINNLGGSLTALTAIYDTMQYIRPQAQAVYLGQAASAATVLFAVSSPGERLTLPGARALIHQSTTEGVQGQASDIQIVANEIDRIRVWLEEALTKHSDIPVEQTRRNIRRDKIFIVAQTKEYGLIDQVLASRKGE